MTLSEWQAAFFVERVRAAATGAEGVYFREQVFGALDVLSNALPELEEALGAANFRFFVRELLGTVQPKDALGTSLIIPFLEFLQERRELREASDVMRCLRRHAQIFRDADAGTGLGAGLPSPPCNATRTSPSPSSGPGSRGSALRFNC